MDFKRSHCKGRYLHKFATFQAHPDAILERCVKQGCGKKHVIKLFKNEPNIVEYARWHQREFLVPQHRLFLSEFQKV